MGMLENPLIDTLNNMNMKNMKSKSALYVKNTALCLLTAAVFSRNAIAQTAKIDIGSGGNDIFANITSFLQSVVDFMVGPFAYAGAVVALVIAILIFIWGSRLEQSLGMMFRGFLGLVALLSLGTIIANIVASE